MSDYFEDYEAEVLENTGREVKLPTEEREFLEWALSSSLEMFSAPGEADPDEALEVIEMLEELYPYVLETKLCDRIGEVIEFLQEICEEGVLGFEDARAGKCAAQAIAEAFRVELFYPEMEWKEAEGR